MEVTVMNGRGTKCMTDTAGSHGGDVCLHS